MDQLNTPEASSQPAMPFLSVMIPTWQRLDLLPATLKSVLEQDLGPDRMEICVMDDPSDNDVKGLVLKIGGERVRYVRHPERAGMVGNWNSCVTGARGRWVHVLHDDDLAFPGLYRALEEADSKHPDLGAFFARCAILAPDGLWTELTPIDSRTPGIWDRAAEFLGESNTLRFPGVIVKRSAYESLGAFRQQAGYVADWDMWRRVAFRYPVYYTPAVLAGYRIHASTITRRTHYIEANLHRSFIERKFLIDSAEAEIPEGVSLRAKRHYVRVLADAIASKLLKMQPGLAFRLFWQAPKFGMPIRVAAFSSCYVAVKAAGTLRAKAAEEYLSRKSRPDGESNGEH